MISEKLKELKNKFNLHEIDGYVIPKNDEYFSEFAKKDFSALLDYACQVAEIKPPRISD